MKCAIYKKADGGASIGMICDARGNVISNDIEAHLNKVVANNPDFVSWRIADHTNLPGGSGDSYYDKTFASAFTDELPGDQLDIDMTKAKELAHGVRRSVRSEKFKPHDEAIATQIPGVDATAEEAARASIRLADATLQARLDGALDSVTLKSIMIEGGLL